MSASVIFTSLTKTFGINCQIFFVTLLFALPLGLIVSFGSMNKWAPFRRLKNTKLAQQKWATVLAEFRPISFLVKVFVWIIRGTPLMLQIIVIFYGPGLLWDGDLLPRLTAVCVAFIINYACYFSEIYRGGIQSIPRGQYEAGQVLGMTKSQI